MRLSTTAALRLVGMMQSKGMSVRWMWTMAGAMAVAAPMAMAQPGGSAPSQPQQPPPTIGPRSLSGAPAAQPIPLPPKPKPPASPLDPKLDVKAAMREANRIAIEHGRRVLVVWAVDPEAEFTGYFVEMMRLPDMQKLLGLEFETVWVETGKSERGAANRELAHYFGAELKGDEQHAWLTVLEPAGKVLANKNGEELIDALRKRAYSVIKAEDFLRPLAAKPPAAQDILDRSSAQAKESKKFVFLTFGEVADEWSGKFKKWLAQPEVVASLGKYAVVSHIELLRDVGAIELMEKVGGVKVQSLPWFVLVGADGKMIATSQTEKMPNIGFPVDDGELGEFLGMLKKAAPGMTDEDSRAIRQSLVEHRSRKK